MNKSTPCTACLNRALCPVSGLGGSDAAPMAAIAVRTFRTGEVVCQSGDDFDGLYVVRSGFFKSFFNDAGGDMQVTGFHFPGEVFGIDGIGTGKYGDWVTALDSGSVCKIPLSVFTGSPSRAGPPSPDHISAMVKLMSNALSRDRSMIFNLGKMDARRRFSTFLQDIACRMARSGYDGADFNLCMSRMDISDYLCLAIETISRLFSQFHAQGIIHVDRRQLKILDGEMLQALSRENLGKDDGLLDKAG